MRQGLLGYALTPSLHFQPSVDQPQSTPCLNLCLFEAWNYYECLAVMLYSIQHSYKDMKFTRHKLNFHESTLRAQELDLRLCSDNAFFCSLYSYDVCAATAAPGAARVCLVTCLQCDGMWAISPSGSPTLQCQAQPSADHTEIATRCGLRPGASLANHESWLAVSAVLSSCGVHQCSVSKKSRLFQALPGFTLPLLGYR